MLALRRVPRRCTTIAWCRRNATAALTPADAPTQLPSSSAASKPEVKASKTIILNPQPTRPSEVQENAENTEATLRKSSRKYPTKRPRISLEHPREWCRPVGIGAIPAYDEALAYIKRDAASLQQELARYREELTKAENATPTNRSEVQRLTEKVKILEVQSEINLPSVRWKASNGMADMSQPVFRHLVEQRWREDGALDLLMERVYQMKVIPDLLPVLRPSIDLRVNYPEPPPESVYLRTRTKRKYTQVEPGVYLLPEQTRKPPKLYTSVFHTDTRLYTMLMVDLDVPHPEYATYQPYLHWMQPNIPLSATETGHISLTTTHTPYIPPHPQKGTPYHRYVILMLPQPNTTETIEIPVFTEQERLGFDFRRFAENYGFTSVMDGGVHMFREVWDETVSHIYKHTLKIEEPVFGRMPKPDRYAEVKKAKKYFHS